MRIAIIGLGRMGTAQARLARYFHDEIVLAVDINTSTALWFSQEFQENAVTTLDDSRILNGIHDLDLIWLTVTDSEISNVAQKLIGYLDKKTVVLHTSGSLSSHLIEEVLPGSACGALHPLIPCPLVDVSDVQCLNHYRGALHTFDGTETARSVAQILVNRLDSPLAEIHPETKSLYHAAAVLASNYPIVLADMACHLFEKCGFSHEQALSAARRLLLQCTNSLQNASPMDALTGPAKRNDIQTIQLHQEALKQYPEMLDIYNVLFHATQNMLEEKF